MSYQPPEAEALISIRPEYVEAIIEGRKTVEFRRRNLKLAPNSRLWIYSTLPTAAVTAVAVVTGVDSGAVNAIWRRHGKRGSIGKADFNRYFLGVDRAFAIEIKCVSVLSNGIDLSSLRTVVDGFQPPQTYVRVPQGHPFLPLFEGAVA
ncbi:ASCH domain-containing protein [Pelagibius litoralis]|uniref:ASCH domain-containing protein n=1 Tax=Pelagibius litoralis TaxID=374515 RepID=A0A967KHE8_9PROT|nr:ASCH domain-containing protein [Pelagibius litoralis]NIA71206.1 ASCH domain-containing protein [Pelagibius litoralis]